MGLYRVERPLFMSRTDKTKPHHVKMDELRETDPYGTRREAWVTWRPEFRCGHTCYCNYGWWEQEKSKARRDRKRQARDWEKEYE